jgi:hypothetical protein
MSEAAQKLPQPRVGFIVTTALLGAFYLIYLLSAVSLMSAMRAGPATLTAAHELPQSDFSFWLWRAVSVLAAAFLLRWAGLGWGVIAAGLASTAGLHDLVGGQNGTLLAGVQVSALLLAKARPGWAGALAGVLAIKPQMALMFPAVALRPGGAKMLLAGALTVLVLVVLSLAV